MRTLVVLLAIVAASSAASIMIMDDKEFEKAMMEHMASQGNMKQMMDILALMDAEQQPQEQPEAVEAEEGVAHDGAEEPAEDQKEVAAVEDEEPRPQPNLSATPHAAPKKPVKRPTNAGNINNKPAVNGNGKKGAGGSAAAASATSFSRGSNSFASSQAQAFSRGSK
ncbi:uncharacterized protein LOC124174010 [Ischnura elegans]|uniref:uncharacterized protein LOC124174010 n=1 Tax=Ischnura elegans TaxID=197161 RepID=UPI001ED8B180|nr:uncharacterized protein LOC124174010 [Ischnura elegans]